MPRLYVTPDGTRYPLYEAPSKYTIDAYKSDCRKAIVADPEQCLIALGAKRDKSVKAAFIGSARDAYIVFNGKRNAGDERYRVDYAMHYLIPAKSAKARDYFDTHKKAKTMQLDLLAPTAGRTLDSRAKQNKERLERIKNGTHTVKPRGKQSKTRIMRIGVAHRPKAILEKNVVTIPMKDDVAA